MFSVQHPRADGPHSTECILYLHVPNDLVAMCFDFLQEFPLLWNDFS
jgi:hypothetical protein